MSIILGRVCIVLALVALCAGVVVMKVHDAQRFTPYDVADGDNYYWTEHAFHFRHFRMVAQGEVIPAVDTGIQYPRGLHTRRYITPLMEQVYGRVYRWWFDGVPMHVFLTWATAIVSTLSVIAVYFAGAAIGGGAWPGLISASLYGLALASRVRGTGGFGREEFALPLLFGATACFFICMRRERLLVAVAGAALLVAAFASWHISQFYYELLVVGLAGVLVLRGADALPRRTVTVYAAAAIGAAIALPVLRYKLYAVSLPVTLSAGLLILLWQPIADARSRRAMVMRAAVLLACAVAGFGAQRVAGAHAHVFAVIFAKVRHLGRLPTDPAALSFEAKTMWTSSFHSPGAVELLLMLAGTLVFGLIGAGVLVQHARRRTLTPMHLLLVYFAAVSLVLYIMFTRMNVLAVFFLALLAAVTWHRRSVGLRAGVVVLLIACLGAQLTMHWAVPLHSPRPPHRLLADVTTFLREHTQPGDAVASSFQLGPSIAAYAHRPVVIHSKFESPQLRRRIEQVYTALYADEQTFFELCDRLGARYFVHQVSMAYSVAPGTEAYFTGHDRLPKVAAAYRFHFAPASLRYFELVHQNSQYRVYRVGRPGARGGYRPPYEPIYDPALFDTDPSSDALSQAQLARGRHRAQVVRDMLFAGSLLQAGRFPQAIDAYAKAIASANTLAGDWPTGTAHPLLPEYLVANAIALHQSGDVRAAEQLCRRAIATDARWPWARFYLGVTLAEQRRLDEAVTELQAALRLSATWLPAYEVLAQVHVARGDGPAAAETIRRALTIWPDQPYLRSLLQSSPSSTPGR